MNNTIATANVEFQFTTGLFAGNNTEQICPSLKAMAHPVRLKILCFLSRKEACVKELVAMLGTTQSNISQHLRILKDAGVVASTRVDSHSFYRITCSATNQMIGASSYGVVNTD